MSIRRPVSTQKISSEKKGTPESGPEQAAAVHDGLPSGVGIAHNGKGSSPTTTDSGDRQSKEETLAESTTPDQQVAPAVDDGNELPERMSTTVTDVADDDPGSPGPDTTVPTKDELKEDFISEVLPGGVSDDDTPDGENESTSGSRLPDRDDLKGDFLGSGAGSDTDVAGFRPSGGFWSSGDGASFGPDGDGVSAKDVPSKAPSIAQGSEDIPIEPIQPETIEADPWTWDFLDDGSIHVEYGDGSSSHFNQPDEYEEWNFFEDGWTTKIKDDGSATAIDPDGKRWQPDPDNEHVPLPEELQQQIDAELARLGEMTPRRRPDDGAEDPVEHDDAAFGAGAGAASGPVADPKDYLLGGDPIDNTAAPSWGDSSGLSPFDGFTDPGPDADGDFQTSGPEEELFPENDLPAETASDSDDGTDDTGTSPYSEVIVFTPTDHVPDELPDELVG